MSSSESEDDVFMESKDESSINGHATKGTGIRNKIKIAKKPSLSKFKQQELRACQPILTPIPVIISLFLIGVVFVLLGILMVVSSSTVVEFEERYDDVCEDKMGGKCTITFDITKDMKKPVYMYYKLSNYYQNHRRYVKSRSDAQLRGEDISSTGDLDDCSPVITKDDTGDDADILLPCGLIAWSVFNDTFQLIREDGSFVPWKKEGIAWKSDLDEKFVNPKVKATGVRTISNFQDEDFVVWMRTAGLPTFKKLYRIIDDVDIDEGIYTVEIQNNYPVDEFDGGKYVVLSTVSWMGGKNPFLGYAYIVVGVICLILAVAFLIRHCIWPRKLGDERYLKWNK
eukprot:TRINITY_DN4579_c0_g1_i1.p1 TRINITY_DN4579_c0_g1~~TRINITY_DN4579_c0_g1_i1.p1  ORF type:complete len:341 (-),score=54.01 TRINITY_DN4579_c0_g1_i1:204-1226(-)